MAARQRIARDKGERVGMTAERHCRCRLAGTARLLVASCLAATLGAGAAGADMPDPPYQTIGIATPVMLASDEWAVPKVLDGPDLIGPETAPATTSPQRSGPRDGLDFDDGVDLDVRAIERFKAPGALGTAFEPLRVIDTAALRAKFAGLRYRLEPVRQGDSNVPRLFLARFPEDLKTLQQASDRKNLFLRAMLPLVLQANVEIRRDRIRLLAVTARRKRGETRTDDEAFLVDLALRYGLATVDLAELRRRVDVIPPSLALAQGAEESGWGTSRFARAGNAVFGQRTFKHGEGIVPLRRENGLRHKVRAFNGLYHSVASYMRNLNAHFAYDSFRRARARMRAEGRPLDGLELTGTLLRYSERGEDYIRTIRAILRGNRLWQFDHARLRRSDSSDRAS